MPLTFFPASLTPDTADSAYARGDARFLNGLVTSRQLSLFNTALDVERAAMRRTRRALAGRLRVFRASIYRRISAIVERRIIAFIETAEKRMQIVQDAALGLAEERALLALREFLGTCEAQPLLEQRLRTQVAALFERLPNRFLSLRVHPSQKLTPAPGVELIHTSEVEIGCAELIGRSGMVTLDWRGAVKRGA